MKNKQVIAKRIEANPSRNVWEVYDEDNSFVGNFLSLKDIENFYNIFLPKGEESSFFKGFLILSPDKQSIIRRNYNLRDSKEEGKPRIVNIVFSRELIEETLILAKLLEKET